MSGAPWQMVAWVDTVRIPVAPHMVRVDIGERHTFVDTPKAAAVVWERADSGSSARAYAASIRGDYAAVEAYTFPASESDPIAAAKKKIMESLAG